MSAEMEKPSHSPMSAELTAAIYPILDDIEVPEALLVNWQVTADLLAEIAETPAALIMRVHAHEIEVFVASQSLGNVYRPGDKTPLNMGLYCETVMSTRRELRVSNALKDPDWSHKLGMISYCGLPLIWPTGELFGTICILDDKEHVHNQRVLHFMERFRDSIQLSLGHMYESSLARRQRGKAESALRESESLRQCYLDATQTVMLALDAQGCVIMINRAGQYLLGYTEAELLGRNWFATCLPQPEGMITVYPAFLRIINGEQEAFAEYENEVLCRDGRRRLIGWRNNRFRDDAGRIVGALSSGEDITERKRAEERLRQAKKTAEDSSRFLNAVADALPSLVGYWSDELRCNFANAAYLSWFGKPLDEMIGIRVQDLLGDELFHQNEPYIRAALRGERQSFERALVKADGSTGYTWAQYIPNVIDGRTHGFFVLVTDITELKRVETLLRESEERFRTMFEQAPLGIALIDSFTGHFLEINPRYAAIVGRSIAVMTKTDWMQITHPDDVQRDLDNMALMNAGKINGFQMEKRYLRPDGTVVWVNLAAVKLKGDANTSPHHLAMVEDITERKQSEATLRGSEKQRHLLEQQKIVQTSLDGFMIMRANDGCIVEVNDIYCQMTGYSREELLSMKIQDVEAMESAEDVAAHIKEIIQIGYDRFETRHRHKLGQMIDFEVSVSHSKDNGGIIFAFLRDITERNRMLEALKKSEHNFRVLFENSSDALMILKPPSYAFTSANQSCLKMFKASDEADFCGLRPCDISPERQADRMTSEEKAKQMLEIALRDGSHFFEWTHLRLDGRMFPAEVLLTRIELDKQVSMQATVRNITERKKLEMEALERRNEMEYLHGKYVAAHTAAAFAHELNQPLLAIASYSGAALMLMDAGNPDPNKLRKAIQGSEHQAQRAGQSIRELLELLSMEEFPTEAFDLNEEILGILDTAKLEHELQFRSVLSLEKKLPLVCANRTHIHKVLLNLLRNGIDAMQGAEVPLPAISVTVRTMKDESVAQITIEDNGPGIRKEDFHKLFEPFFSTKSKGIGMGLVISRSLIEENGGQLWVDPREGSGAIFHLTLPFAA